MDEFFDLPTLIVIGLAIVILFRLRSVLGTRTGNERSPLERRGGAARPGDDTVVQMRPRPAEAQTDENAERQARRLESEIDHLNGYVVRKGDTLWSIAQKFGVEVQALKKWNGLGKDGHRGLQVGRTLYIAPTRKADAGGSSRG